MPTPSERREPAWDVLGLGCAAVDDCLYVAAYPGADEKVPVRRRERHCGGQTATALVAAARLGARAAFAGVLGDDDDSRFVLDCLRREGVDVAPAVRRPGARPIHATVVVDEAHNTRTIFYDLTGSAGAALDAPPADVLRSTRVLLIDQHGVEGMTRAARIARAAGIAVVADFERHEGPGFMELLGRADHLIVAWPFAQGVTGATTPAAAVDRLWADDRQVVAVTCGADGCWYRDRSGAVLRQPAFAVAVRDTTGCGDVFHGAYAAALARGLGVAECLRFAAAAAALKATQAGGHAAIPRRDAVEALAAPEACFGFVPPA